MRSQASFAGSHSGWVGALRAWPVIQQREGGWSTFGYCSRALTPARGSSQPRAHIRWLKCDLCWAYWGISATSSANLVVHTISGIEGSNIVTALDSAKHFSRKRCLYDLRTISVTINEIQTMGNDDLSWSQLQASFYLLLWARGRSESLLLFCSRFERVLLHDAPYFIDNRSGQRQILI